MDKINIPTIKELVLQSRVEREITREKSKKRTSLYRKKMKVYK